MKARPYNISCFSLAPKKELISQPISKCCLPISSSWYKYMTIIYPTKLPLMNTQSICKYSTCHDAYNVLFQVGKFICNGVLHEVD